MGVRATFNVDFTTFQSEVAKATVAWQRFEGETKNVAKDLSAMTNSFTGRAVITQATLMAEAIERIGGVSKLTAAELERVGNTAAAAAAKFAAWGKAVPAPIQDLTRFATDASGAMSGLEQILQTAAATAMSFATGLASAFSVRAVVTFIQDTVDAAQKLRALSIETGITTSELQALTGVSAQYGVGVDQMARAVDMLEKRIGFGGDTGAAAAIHRMGLTLQEFSGLEPIEKLFKVAEAMGHLETQAQRTATASELFGERLDKAVLRMGPNIADLMERWKNLNNVIADDTTAKLAHAGDVWDAFWRNLKVSVITNTAPAVENVTKLNEALRGGASTWEAYLAYWQTIRPNDRPLQWILNLLGKDLGPDPLGSLLARQKATDIDLPRDRPTGTGNKVVDKADVLKAILEDQNRLLSEQDTYYLNALYDAKLLTAENAKALDIDAKVADLYKKRLDAMTAERTKHVTETREMLNLQTELSNRYGKTMEAQNEQAVSRLAHETAYVGVLVQEGELARKFNADRALGAEAKTDMDHLLEQLKEVEARAEAVATAARDRALADAARRAKLTPEDIGFLSPADYQTRLAQIANDYNQMLTNLKAVTGPQVEKIWRDFDEKLFGPLKRAIRDTTAMFSAGEDILPWSKLGPAAIGVKPIVAGSFGGVGTINVNMQVSGIWDPATTREMSKAFSAQVMRDAGRR